MSDATLERLLGQIEGKVDALHARLDEALKVRDDHEDRLRGLERWRWALVGGFGSLAALFKFSHGG